MSKPSIATVADAVVVELNDPARNWAQAFTAKRKWLERPTSKKLKDMQVTVMTAASQQVLYNRQFRLRGHEILIVFRKNVDPDNTDAVDALAAFVETVADYYGADPAKTKRKVAGTEAVVDAVLVDPIVSPDELETNTRFFSALTLTISEIADIAAVDPGDSEPATGDGDGGGIVITEILNGEGFPPFGGVGGVTGHANLLTPVEEGLLVFVLYIFGRSGSNPTTVTFGEDRDGIGGTPLTQDASVPLPAANGVAKIFSLPVEAGDGWLVVDLGGDTAYLAGSPLNLTGLHLGMRNAVNVASGSGIQPQTVATSTTTNEAIIAAFAMQTADTIWAWLNDYEGGHDYTDDFSGFVNWRATVGWRLAGSGPADDAKLSGVTPAEWAALAVSYR